MIVVVVGGGSNPDGNLPFGGYRSRIIMDGTPTSIRTPVKTGFSTGNSKRGFWPGGIVRAGLYARVSSHDQQTLPLQLAAMRDYVVKRESS